MRYRNLVFAAVFGLFIAVTAQSQTIELGQIADGPRADGGLKGGKKADPRTPQVTGQVTDFAGRSVKAAEVRFIGVEFDEVVTVRTNVFGFYQVGELTPGRSYFISVQHRKYLFLGTPTEILVGDEPVVVDFEGESAR